MKYVSENDIKMKLMQHHSNCTVDRSLKRYVHNDSYETIGTVFYSLNGSPPKGWAVYIPELWLLSFYDVRGRRFRILRDVVVNEIKEEVLSGELVSG